MVRKTEEQESELRRLSDRTVHDLVLRRLAADYPGVDATTRAVLDIPCGSGVVSAQLDALGFRVTCSDIDPGNFQLDPDRLVVANLNETLPFESASFDAIVSIAGLQRLTTPEAAISEWFRVLKPNGRLYLGLPNFANLKKRVRYFLYGSQGNRFDRPKYVQSLSQPEANFRFPLVYARVENLLLAAGLEVEPPIAAERSLYPYVLLPLSLVAWAASRLRARQRRRNQEAYKRGTSFAMLGTGNYLIVAKKPEGIAARNGSRSALA